MFIGTNSIDFTPRWDTCPNCGISYLHQGSIVAPFCSLECEFAYEERELDWEEDAWLF